MIAVLVIDLVAMKYSMDTEAKSWISQIMLQVLSHLVQHLDSKTKNIALIVYKNQKAPIVIEGEPLRV